MTTADTYGHLALILSLGNVEPDTKIRGVGVEKMAPWLRALAALMEDLGSVSNTRMAFPIVCNSSSKGPTPSLTPGDAQTHTEAKHSNT